MTGEFLANVNFLGLLVGIVALEIQNDEGSL